MNRLLPKPQLGLHGWLLMPFLPYRGSRPGLFRDFSAGEFCPLRILPTSRELRFPPLISREKDEGLPPGISEKASGPISTPSGQCVNWDLVRIDNPVWATACEDVTHLSQIHRLISVLRLKLVGYVAFLITSKALDVRRRGATTEAYGVIRRKEERSKATQPFGFAQGREPVERQMMP